MVKQNKIQENNFNKIIFNRVNQKKMEIAWSLLCMINDTSVHKAI